MLEDDLIDRLDATLKPLGCAVDPGIEFRDPPLDILRIYARPVRLHWLPLIGRAASLVAVLRQPVDLTFDGRGAAVLLDRLGRALNGRYPPWSRPGGLALGVTAVVLTPEPISPRDDGLLGELLAHPPRLPRITALGVLRLNPGQEAMAFALKRGPGGLFPEPQAVADALVESFRRFVPLIDLEG